MVQEADFQEKGAMEFTIFDIIRFYAGHVRLLLVAFVVIFAAAFFMFLTSAKQYEAGMDVLPPDTRQQSQGVAGGLAQALMGESGNSPDFGNFLTSLGAVQLGEKLMADPAIATKIFADRWDAEKKQWKPAGGLRSMVGRGLRSLFGLEPWAPPTAFEMRDYIKGAVKVTKVTDSRASRLAYQHTDPAFAKLFLGRVVRELDTILRTQKLAQIGQENDALRARFNVEQNSSVRDYMLRWISENENKIVEAESAEFFAFRVLDPLSVNPQPVTPRPLFALIISFILAVVGGILLLGLLGFIRILRRNMGAA
ncbi:MULTISPECIES: hypothetical protein [unclassified Azospirillum]|uniref:hypothetical protein n=1 Tax=unclassified Azospirillum TaxID=2630922 RepID=UPI000B630979|nr:MULTISPECIES: hypothetical protein [unclassified Azospirillum]SNS69380.1 hypothetical protein SAMN05880556_109148 [Azospirillum sp. RU38E]SNS87436.1 hypothetical protein SAMN05880591_109148 [Azospirillum sp. RU37A]